MIVKIINKGDDKMGKKIDRTGEKGINNFGSEMIIVKYRTSNDIDVYFPEYDWIAKGVQYGHFKRGKIKCLYDKIIYKIGYLGEGKYKVWENGKTTKIYSTWYSMLNRCYSDKYHKRHTTYINCEVSEDWHNFQNFGKWYDENYYEVNGERMCLDKDILVKHNKIYSPDACVFVPERINLLFTKNDKDRGDSVIGTSSLKNGKYRVYCNLINPETGKSKYKHLGCYDTQEKAFEVYKYYKERNIKEVADYFKEQIPKKLYQALYNYEVEIDD